MPKKFTAIKQANDSFLLSCKVEGKSYGTIESYADKLKGFLWYATNYDWPNNIQLITWFKSNRCRFILTCSLETKYWQYKLGNLYNYGDPDIREPLNNSLRTASE